MNKLISFLLIIAVAGSMLLVGGCAPEEDKISIGYVNWMDAISITYLNKVIIEENFDYEVETTMADAGPVFQGLSTGEIDLFLDVWLPVTHKDYLENVGEDITEIGVSYSRPDQEGSGVIGMVVPEDVDIDSIYNLNEYSDKFDGEIIGIDAGAGIMEITRDVIDELDLDFELIEGSEPAMVTALKDAYENEEWIVVTGWLPHWKFGRWNLKFLDDPDNLYGEVETAYTYSRKNFKEDYPKLTKYLENFNINTDDLAVLMKDIADAEDEDEYIEIAQNWVEENEEIVEKWLDI